VSEGGTACSTAGLGHGIETDLEMSAGQGKSATKRCPAFKDRNDGFRRKACGVSETATMATVMRGGKKV
jgi:hypothetical protein